MNKVEILNNQAVTTKTVVTTVVTPVVCQVNRYYGVKKGETVGFVSRESYERGNFTALVATMAITKGNNWGFATSPHLQELLEKLICEDFGVFAFDTPIELFDWVAKSLHENI